MDFILPFKLKKHSFPMQHHEKVMLIGSCFTENIGKRMKERKMNVLQNPHGILFNPGSIANCIGAYLDPKIYEEDDLFFLNDTWNNWDFHSRFSHTSKQLALQQMRESVQEASDFIRSADWLIITLGSSYQYFTTEIPGAKLGYGVANCHKAPGSWFEKRLLTIDEMVARLGHQISLLLQVNPTLKLIFTVSPVRHVRDGVVENNRSKGRLLEVVHQLAEKWEQCSYFPAYELVNDVLRDYRFFESDLVHPNDMAIEYVWEQFTDTFLAEDCRDLLVYIEDIVRAATHKLHFPEREASLKFKTTFVKKIEALQQAYPYIDWQIELDRFK